MTINILKEKIKNKIWNFLKDYFYSKRVTDSPILQNVNFDCNTNQKKAVVCYLPYSYFTNLENTLKSRTQPFEILIIMNILSDLGYRIDLIKWNDVDALEVVKNKNYDLIFGFGESFYQLTNLNPAALSVLYMTENPPEFSFREERKRIDYYYERHGRKLKIMRSGIFYKIHHLQKKYSNAIAMGELDLLKNQYNNPYSIFPTGLINHDYKFSDKNHEQARTHFLWLGSGGAVHKGLDLLLDIFSQYENMVLHICGLQKPDRKQLIIPKKKNIVLYGHIGIESDLFLKLVDTCSYIILPSCSEGCSTSITTGMLHGLIPVVMRNAGFNRLGENVIYLEDFKIDYLAAKLKELANCDVDSLFSLSKQVFDFARINFSLTTFEKNLRTIFLDITKNNN